MDTVSIKMKVGLISFNEEMINLPPFNRVNFITWELQLLYFPEFEHHGRFNRKSHPFHSNIITCRQKEHCFVLTFIIAVTFLIG